MRRTSLLYNTVKHLKPIQIGYQIKYRLIKPRTLSSYCKSYKEEAIEFLFFKEHPPVYKSYFGENTFVFLNQKKTFQKQIDWNFLDYGKLWNYNLQYANYLLQEDVSVEHRRSLLLSMYKALDTGNLALEPYPVSLRSINTIRFLSFHQLRDSSLYGYLYGELTYLSHRPEYHLLGNHLLENAFALIMGGAFFQNKSWLAQGQKLLQTELKEQLLLDGAHYELSPMYHQIILFRLLELCEWYNKWKNKSLDFEVFIRKKAGVMMAWLKNISFNNGDIPHFNDSSSGVAYSTNWLIAYGKALGISLPNLGLNDSGYRAMNTDIFELRIDCTQIAPSYQPGHSHADALGFILYKNNAPLLVERGTSTYNIGKRRDLERATKSHNTVVLDNLNQSEVWGGFRVGKRALTIIIKEEPRKLQALHNGYKTKYKAIHSRTFSITESTISIEDKVTSSLKAIAYFHFHPQVDVSLNNTQVEIKGIGWMRFKSNQEIEIKNYKHAVGFNKYLPAKVVCVSFYKSLQTIIEF